MDSTTIEAMHEQVRVIYRAVTGAQLEDDNNSSASQVAPEENDLERRFAQLNALVRTKPELAQRIPPFSFEPQVDVLEGQDELLIEVALPGVEPSDVAVEWHGTELVVSGMRRGACGSNGRTFLRAEIPRGPFRTSIHLPCQTSAPARVDVERGIVVIQLQKQPWAPNPF